MSGGKQAVAHCRPSPEPKSRTRRWFMVEKDVRGSRWLGIRGTTARFSRLVVCAGLVLACSVPPPAQAFDTWWHAEATRHAMTANGFSADARLVVQVSNYL